MAGDRFVQEETNVALVNSGDGFKRFVAPGEGGDGFREPTWVVLDDNGSAYGGNGDWLYVFWPNRPGERMVVDTLRIGKAEVERVKLDLSSIRRSGVQDATARQAAAKVNEPE
ncbi:MAG: hypothetical protein P8099_13175 [Gemmatimonadota bacterium]